MMKCKDVSEFDGGCMTGSDHLQTAALVGVLGLEEVEEGRAVDQRQGD